MKKSRIFIFFLILFSSVLCAEEWPGFAPDRPGTANGPAVVSRGLFHYEGGFSFSLDKFEQVKTKDYQYFSSLFRVGLAENWELRVGWNGYLHSFSENSQSSSAAGIGDGTLGTKISLTQKEVFELGILAEIVVPIGRKDFSADALNPILLLMAKNKISDSISTTWNLGVNIISHNSLTTNTLWVATVDFGFFKNTGLFFELYGILPNIGWGDNTCNLGGGLTYLFNDNLQLDTSFTYGLNNPTPDWTIGFGISTRLRLFRRSPSIS